MVTIRSQRSSSLRVAEYVDGLGRRRDTMNLPNVWREELLADLQKRSSV